MAKKEAPKFTQVSPSEVRVDYRGIKFLVGVQDRGDQVHRFATVN